MGTGSDETRPEAKPGLVPLNEGARQVERILELPTSMDKVNRAGRRRMEGHRRQGRRWRARRRATQARCNWLEEVHIHRTQADHNRGVFLLTSPGYSGRLRWPWCTDVLADASTL